MATFRASTSSDMSAPVYLFRAFGGSVISIGPNLIALRDPLVNRQDYLGSFSYHSFSWGTYNLNWSSSNLTGFRQYTGTTSLAWSITDLSIPGSVYYSYALSGNGEGFVSYALRGNDFIYGSNSGDVLFGYAGNDYLDGRAGADIMRGGLGNDTYIVDNTGDLVEEAASAGTDTVQSSISYTLGANVENLILTGSGVINGTGNGLNNVITGNGSANLIDGGNGSDTLNGGSGNDRLIGGNGNDNLNGGAGADTLTGIALNDTTLGRGTIDVLTGGTENDLFVLGNASGVFYSDGSTSTSGRGDYARITDFAAGDRIQLKGSASNYILRSNDSVTGFSGVGLYRNDGVGTGASSGWDSRDEFIALIQVGSGVGLNLGNTSQFTYVS